jgi:hypothetical protein
MLKKLAMASVHNLCEHNMVKIDSDGFCLRSTLVGEIAARHYIQVKTMRHFAHALNPVSSESDIITALSNAAEFEQYVVRQEEKKPLRLLNDKVLCVSWLMLLHIQHDVFGCSLSCTLTDCVYSKTTTTLRRRHSRPKQIGGWSTIPQKIDCMLQAFLSQDLPEFSQCTTQFRMASKSVSNQAERVCAALEQFLRRERRWFTPTREAILMVRSLSWMQCGGLISLCVNLMRWAPFRKRPCVSVLGRMASSIKAGLQHLAGWLISHLE